MSRVGLVAIGRNEGERLRRCLVSALAEPIEQIVYVDSGSTDGSSEMARELGVHVVELDMSRPFSAARARNEGFRRLTEVAPECEFVQFVDGDMQIVPGWVSAAVSELAAHPDVVAVCGWRHELHPERTIYNRICEVEWQNGCLGEITCFGGDVMIRASAFAAAGGYDPQVIAAEDDELAFRLRRDHGALRRIDHGSTLHDANMVSWRQWWTRAKRCGYAYAQVAALHGRSPQRKFVRERRRALLWGALFPAAALVLAWPTHGASLVLLARYPYTLWKTLRATRRRGFSWAESWAWSLSCTASAFPEALGVLRFFRQSLGMGEHQIIEYKKPSLPSGSRV